MAGLEKIPILSGKNNETKIEINVDQKSDEDLPFDFDK